MKDEEYGPCNITVTLGYPQSFSATKKRRLSQQSKLPLNQNAKKRNRSSNNSSNIKSIKDEKEEERDEEQQEEKTRQWSCHTQILYKESPYFAALLGDSFIESEASTVSLPSNIITNEAMENILLYMYTHQMQPKKNAPNIVKELGDIYMAADYLLMDRLCDLILEVLFNQVVHKCICYCNSCIMNVPELLLFCRNRNLSQDDERMVSLSQKLVSVLTNDPEKSLSSFWTGRHMAKLLIQLPQDTSNSQGHLLSQKILARVNKSNAIESLYACFTASNILSTHDPLLSWSKPLHSTLTSVQSAATRIIATHFDFFCSQYPALLSCIDGITYSFEFLEYLLLHVLEDQMDCSNVGILYKGIFIDLMSRHAVQYNTQVKHILSVAKVMILYYIIRRINDIKLQGGLDKLDKSVIKVLADDLDVKPKSLLSSNHPLLLSSQHGVFSFLMPSISNLTSSSSTTTQNTNAGLSRYPSRSTTTSSGPVNQSRTKLSLFAKRLSRLFKNLSSEPTHHYTPFSSPPLQQRKMPARYASNNTVNTMASTSSLPWFQEMQFSNYNITSSRSKQRRRRRKRCLPSCINNINNSQQPISVPIVGINKRVQLSRRPTLTVGTVLFIGHVNFADGVWIGVELDRRVGKNDGSVNGDRYFTSSPNRGVFVRPEDVSIVL